MKTYTTKNGRTIEARGRDHVEDILHANRCSWEMQTFIRLTDRPDGSESRTVLSMPIGNVPNSPERIALYEKWKKHLDTYTIINPTNEPYWRADCAKAAAELAELRPVIDERIGAEEWAKIEAESAARDAERKAAQAQAEDAAKIVAARWPRARRFIVVHAVKDDSDAQSDYYGQHDLARFTIAADSGSRDDFRPLRAALASVPGLAAMPWTEERRKYSGGSGYYLQTTRSYDNPVTMPEWAPNGTSWLEVRYTTGYSGPTPPLHPLYTEPPQPVYDANQAGAAQVDGITVQRNAEREGVEIIFPAKPDQATLDALKAQGFRFSFTQRLWYAKFTTERHTFALALAGQ